MGIGAETPGEISGGKEEPVTENVSGDGVVDVETARAALLAARRDVDSLTAQVSRDVENLRLQDDEDDVAALKTILKASRIALHDARMKAKLEGKKVSEVEAAHKAQLEAKQQAEVKAQQKAEREPKQKADFEAKQKAAEADQKAQHVATQIAALVSARTRKWRTDFVTRQEEERDAERLREINDNARAAGIAQQTADLAYAMKRRQLIKYLKRFASTVVIAILWATFVYYIGWRRKKKHNLGPNSGDPNGKFHASAPRMYFL